MTQCPISPSDWRKVRARIDERLTPLTRKLEGKAVDPVETAFLRGRIAALRDLIAWGEPTEQPTLTSGGDY